MDTSTDLPVQGAALLRGRSFRLLLSATAGGFAGYALLLPVIPLWSVMGGAGEVSAGATTAVYMLATVTTQLFMPWLLQKASHRALFGTGMILIGGPAPLFALSNQFWLVLIVCVLRGVGFGLLTVTGSVMVAVLVPPAQRGRAAGWHGLSIGLPNLLLLPAGVWLAQRIGFVPLFWTAGAIPVIAAVAMLWMPRTQTSRVRRARSRGWGVVLLPPWTTMTMAAAAAGGLTAFLPLFLSSSIAPTALMIFAGASILGRWSAGQLGDRLGQVRVLLPAIVFSAAGIAVLVPVTWDTQSLALLGAAVFGAGFGAIQNATLIVMFERVDSGAAGTAWNVAFDAGQGLGAVGFGVMIATSGYPATFVISTAVLAVCFPLALVRARRRRNRGNVPLPCSSLDGRWRTGTGRAGGSGGDRGNPCSE